MKANAHGGSGAANRPLSPSLATLAVVLVGSAVAVTLGVLGAVVGEPRALPAWGFSSVQTLKAWVASAVLVLVGVQLLTALWLYRWLPGRAAPPGWVRPLHRLSGAGAVLTSLPVACYCLYGFGFSGLTSRTLTHSVAGCAFYGAFTAKMLTLRIRRLPPGVLPVLGGATFSLFVLSWTVSAGWWFNLVGMTR